MDTGKMAKLIVFDLDGTISVNPEFYRKVYSGTLERLVAEKHGKEGSAMLKYCREKYNGKGELALFALDIPFRNWAELLVNAPLELLAPQSDLCELFRNVRTIKVVYTGSPIEMAIKILERIGFNPAKDFNLILGWQEPEAFPVKWTCSPIVFEKILNRFSVRPNMAWAVGDVWDTDLMPAKELGAKTAMVTKQDGNPDVWFPSVNEFLKEVIGKENNNA